MTPDLLPPVDGRASAQPTRVVPLRRKIQLAALVVLITLAGSEGAVRVRAWMRYGEAAPSLRDPMLTYDADADLNVPTPGYEIVGNKIHIKINSLGFRGDEITREKPAKTVRIACLGASTTFCAEVSSNRETWPHILQDRLRKAYPGVNIEVVNAAVAGYVANDNLKNLRHRVLPLDPDLVIYYEANNEIVHDTGEVAMREGLTSQIGRPPLVSWLSKYSLLFDLTYKNMAIIQSRWAAPAHKMDRVPAELPTRFVGVLDQMRADLAKKGVPLMLSTFIVKYRHNQDRPTQIANADVAFYYMPWMSIDGLLSAMDVYNQAILDYAKRSNLPAVDDREAIPPDAGHFADCMHLADKGAEAMADRFYRYLHDQGVMDGLVAKASAQ